jgi:PAS domain S-box-containing protein
MASVGRQAKANRYSTLAYGFLGLFVLTVLGSLVYALYKDRETQLERHIQRVQGNALVYEDQITQTLQWVENMMRSLPDVAGVSLRHADAKTLERLLQKLQFSQPALRSFSIYSPGEGIRASSNPSNLGVRLNMASFDPPDHVPSEHSVLRMGPSWQGRDLADGHPIEPGQTLALDQAYFFPVMMRVGQGDQSLLLVAALNPDFLLNRLERYNPANAELMVMQRLDGSTLMTTWETVAQAQAHTAIMLKRIQNEELGMLVGEWLSAFRSSSRYPFFITVQVSQTQVLAAWQQKFWVIATAALTGLLAVVAAAWVLMRRIHRNESAERAYQQTILQYSQALEQSPSGILILDDQGRVVYCNAFWSQLSGFDEVHTLGRPPRILDAAHTAQAQVEHIWKKLHSGMLWRGEFVQPHKDGHLFTAVVMLAPLRNEEGDTTHYICIQHDISAMKKMQSELQTSRDKAEAATLAKSQFLANMSHEIRTPMNGLIGMTQLALDEPLPQQAREYVANAHLSAVSLLGILNDILDFSKIEAGKLQLEWLPVRLTDLMAQVLALQGVAAQSKGLLLHSDIDAEVPAQLMTDPLRLAQILNNLIGKPFVRFEVSDTGIGMTAEQLGQLFKPFTQADGSTTRLFGGTGLGLAISRSLCQLLDGQLHITSVAQQGTCATVSLPLKRLMPLSRQTQPEVTEQALQRLAGAEVLLVEDHPMNRQLLHALLAKLGIHTMMADNGQEALDCLNQWPDRFDVVLMDVQMPVMDGIRATQRIREDLRFSDLPVIAVTANAMSDEREECFRAGMQDYLAKPVNRKTLHLTLLKWI